MPMYIYNVRTYVVALQTTLTAVNNNEGLQEGPNMHVYICVYIHVHVHVQHL